jgi:ferritin
MLKETIQKALNEQLNAETYSAYLYLSMSAYCEEKDLKGMASWFRVQAQEELIHAGKFFTFLNDRDGRVLLSTIAGPPHEWASSLAAFEDAYHHEQKITASLSKIAELAMKEGDHITITFLQWFLNEQIEEEATAKGIVGQLKMIGDNQSGLYLLDEKLGTRVFVYPPATAA